MQPRINIKVHRISDGCYRAVSDELGDLAVEGKTVWEALEAARSALQRLCESRSSNVAG